MYLYSWYITFRPGFCSYPSYSTIQQYHISSLTTNLFETIASPEEEEPISGRNCLRMLGTVSNLIKYYWSLFCKANFIRYLAHHNSLTFLENKLKISSTQMNSEQYRLCFGFGRRNIFKTIASSFQWYWERAQHQMET